LSSVFSATLLPLQFVHPPRRGPAKCQTQVRHASDAFSRNHSWAIAKFNALAAGMRRAIEDAMNTILPYAAIGYSILYMIFGGGLFGAVVIFVIAKIFRK
jgi:hypothetical protein